jgi:hypothetical protein
MKKANLGASGSFIIATSILKQRNTNKPYEAAYCGVHDRLFICADGSIASDSGRTASVISATVSDWMQNISPAEVPNTSAGII